jgi:nucleoside triphosphatase
MDNETMPSQKFPEPTVRILIFNPNGEILLLKSHKWPDQYVVPGGHVELGEQLEKTVIRETLEETGLHVHDLHFLFWQEFIYDPAFWKRRHFMFFNFACRVESQAVQLNDEAEDYIWVSPEKAFDLPLDTYTRNALLEYIKTSPR